VTEQDTLSPFSLSLPRFAGQKFDARGDPRRRFLDVPRTTPSEERAHVRREAWISDLLREVLLEDRTRDLRPLVLHVVAERLDDALGIGGGLFEGERKVEEVPPFLPLVESTELGAEQFVEPKARSSAIR